MSAAIGESECSDPDALPPPMRARVVGLAPGLLSSADAGAAVHRIVGDSGRVFGAVVSLERAGQEPAHLARAVAEAGGRLLIRPARAMEGEIPWLPTARRRFEETCELVAAGMKAAGAGCRPVLWPHAGCAVSDGPSLATFMRAREDWGFVLDPVAMLTAGMLDRAEDHLTRLFETLGGHPGAQAVVLGVPRKGGGVVAPSLEAAGRDESLWRFIVELCQRTCPAELPILVPADHR